MPKMTPAQPAPDLDQMPTQPAKTAKLLDAEATLSALIVQRDQYENLRTAAIERADVDGLLRVDAHNTVLPSLIDAAEVAVLNARIDWLQGSLPLFDDPLRQHVDAISALVEQRRGIDEEIGRHNFILSELDGRRDGIRTQTRASEIRRDELIAKSPAARRVAGKRATSSAAA